jgi:hypothetical protein
MIDTSALYQSLYYKFMIDKEKYAEGGSGNA